MIPEAYLLDNIVGSAPRFDFEAVRDPVDRLMVRAVYFDESMFRRATMAQWLDIPVLHLGGFVTRNIEFERAAERDIQNLEALANGQDR